MKRALAAVQRDCWLCLQPLDFEARTPDPESVELDEIVPVCMGGSPTDLDNCCLVHRKCNLKKGGRMLPHGAFAPLPGKSGRGPVVSRSWL